MRRWASNIFCGLCLLLSLLLLIYALFYADVVRGVWLKRTEVISFAGKKISTPHIYYVNINGTELVFGHWRNPQAIEDSQRTHTGLLKIAQKMREKRSNMARMQQGMPDSHKAQMSETLAVLDKQISDLQSENRGHAWSVADGFHAEYHDGLYSTPFRSVPSFGGIKFDSLPSWSPPAIAFRCFLPIWYLLTVLLMAPAARGFSILRRYRRRRANVCRNCGYDLRASPELCPECGIAPI
jgi:hypothetical protein